MTAQQLLNDQRFLFRDFPTETATIADIDYPCLVLNASDQNDWIEGGRLDSDKASIVIQRSSFAKQSDIPTQGVSVIWRDLDWETEAVDHDHLQSPVRLDLRRRVK